MRTLILGGAGFGGSALVHRLIEKGLEVTILDKVAPRHAELVRELYERGLIKYNWKSTLDIVPEDVKGYNVIYDFAAQADVPFGFSSPIHTATNNIVGIYKLMEGLKEYSPDKFIYMGSGTTFGPNQAIPINESAHQHSANPYSASKHCAEIIILAYHRAFGIPVTVLRNGIVFGEHMRQETVVARFITNALLEKPLVVEGGTQTRDLNYITNAIDALELILKSDNDTINGEIFHCATGVETAINDLAQIIIELTGSSSEIQHAPYRQGERDVHQCLDCSKAYRTFGYKPKISLKEGLEKTIEWFEKEIQLRGLRSV